MSNRGQDRVQLHDDLNETFGDDADFVSRTIPVPSGRSDINVHYIETLIDDEKLNEFVIVRLQDAHAELRGSAAADDLDRIQSTVLSVAKVYRSDKREQLVQAILTGQVALTINGINDALVIPLPKREEAEVSETEPSIQSGNEAFTTSMSKNYNLLRLRLPSTKLMFRQMEIGRTSHTKVRVAWLNNAAKPQVVEELCGRLDRIDVDVVHSISVLTELTEDNPLSLWPQYKLTERVDVTVANMAEGRVAILCDGFPFVIVVPLLVLQEFQTPDDYSQKWLFSSIMRMTRIGAFVLSSTLSSLYVSFVAYNHSIMPPSLAIRISAGRSEVPFPSVIEVLLMTFMIDVLKEAGIRLPKGLGQSIGFLGAVVIGQSAVEAGYVSPVVIIIVAISAISSFALPSINLTNMSRVTNYLLIILATLLGLFGVIIGLVYLLWRLVSLRSLGVSISHPMDVGRISLMKDMLIRSPVWKLRARPNVLSDNEKTMGDRTGKPDPNA
ncbi:spore germination protein [Cohnella sp. GCM10027633]|uniref:spore germination protein n=1 Tax=unclassified Cohnella TaxID=2636738 RepID=UPI003639D9C7